MTYQQYVRELHEKIEMGLQVITDMQSIMDTQVCEIQRLQRKLMDLEPCDRTAAEYLGGEPVFIHELERDIMVPPEKRPEVAASKNRVKKASELFNDNFDSNGSPTTERGEKLCAKYQY